MSANESQVTVQQENNLLFVLNVAKTDCLLRPNIETTITAIAAVACVGSLIDIDEKDLYDTSPLEGLGEGMRNHLIDLVDEVLLGNDEAKVQLVRWFGQ